MESVYKQNNICVGMECKDAVKKLFSRTWLKREEGKYSISWTGKRLEREY